MRSARRGRAHLERLLSRAEKVVRVTPADVIVLTGVDDLSGDLLTRALEEFERQGVQARGLIALEPGMDVHSIDVEELVRMDALAEEVEADLNLISTVVGSASADELTVSAKCPRCLEMLRMTVSASVHDTGARLIGSTSVDSRDMELHAIVCKGEKPASQ